MNNRARKKTVSYEKFLIESIKDPKEALGYLNASFEDEDPRVFLLALRDVIKAQGGMGKIAKKTRLNRESLYRMLSLNGNPEIRSLARIAQALGWRLAFVKRGDSKLEKAA